MILRTFLLFIFFFNDTATTEIYTLSLHDALPILGGGHAARHRARDRARVRTGSADRERAARGPSVKIGRDTSELQSQSNLVCRLLLEKKKKKTKNIVQYNKYILNTLLFTLNHNPS